MPVERTSISSSQTAFRRVKWEARTVAIVAKPNVQVSSQFFCRLRALNLSTSQSIVQAACKHFRVTAPKEEFVLLGQLDGDELELTDESLDLLPSKSVLTLSRISVAAFPAAKVEPMFVNSMAPIAATTSQCLSLGEGKINLEFSTYVLYMYISQIAPCPLVPR